MSLEFRGKHKEFLYDTAGEIDLEGALSSGKTSVCLWKELEAYKAHPGIWGYFGRYADDSCKTLLRPAFEQHAALHGTIFEWNREESYYQLGNGSRVFCYGLKTVSPDADTRYKKVRGLVVSRIYVDQAEELPGDIASELRARLRPDIGAKIRDANYPRQLVFSPNPIPNRHWLAKQFPDDNKTKGRRYYSLSLYDNAHNLDREFIENQERIFPPEHPKHRTMILGLRGLNVTCNAIFENLFDRDLHVKPLMVRLDQPLLEVFIVGQHNPTWMMGQRTHHGSLLLLGGIMGEQMMLEDFLPLVLAHRADWFPNSVIKTCTAPMGETKSTTSGRHTLLGFLRDAGFKVVWRENANAPDVQLAMIEEIGAMLRRRTAAREEALLINKDPQRWLSASMNGSFKQTPFLAFAFEGGFVWNDLGISVSNTPVRRPYDDDEYSNAMRCVENLVLNFCAGRVSQDERDRVSEREARVARQNSEYTPPSPNSWQY